MSARGTEGTVDDTRTCPACGGVMWLTEEWTEAGDAVPGWLCTACFAEMDDRDQEVIQP